MHSLAHARALLVETDGEHARAAELFAGAAENWRGFGSVVKEADALVGQGRCLTACRDLHADQSLRQVRALFEQMGARPHIHECDSLIAQASKLSS